MTSETWRVGVLFSTSGITAAVECTQRNATLLAIEQINSQGGVCGRLIEPIDYNPESDPKKYREYAERLCDQDKVSVIFGCYMSSSRKAALPVIEARGALLFYPTLYEGYEYSQHCIYTGTAPNQNSVQLVTYVNQKYGNRIVMIGSNYVYPYESNRVIADLFSQAGGRVLDERYLSLNAKADEYKAVVDRIAQLNPDAIYSTVVGDGIALFYQAYRDAGLNPETMPIISLSTSEAEIAQMPAGTAQGHITAAPYFEGLDTPKSHEFMAAYHARFGSGARLTACAEAAFFQVHLYAIGLERAGTDHFPFLLPHLHNAEFDAPQGRVKIDNTNNHTHLWSRVGKVNSEGLFDVVFEPGVRVAPDPYMLEHYLDGRDTHAVRLTREDTR
ncbi:transporter substrate-binding domain-containing protein [Pseudomonas mohnii]